MSAAAREREAAPCNAGPGSALYGGRQIAWWAHAGALQAPCLESLEAGLQQPEILVAFLALGSSL